MGSNARLMGGSSARKEGASNRYYGDTGLEELREACGMDTVKPGKVSCLRCQEDFNSPDKIRIRICHPCKRDSTWRGSQEADVLYPAISKNMGYGTQAPKVGSKGTRKKGLSLGRSLSRKKKHFGKKPLAKKRTRS